MTDERADQPDFDDPAHDPVRELLSSARVEGPIPAEVAARLDATLAELTGRTAADTDDPVVVPLRRRGRLGPRLLAAAAVVVVVGAGAVGLRQVLDPGSDAQVSADSAAAGQTGGSPLRPELAPAAPGTGDPDDTLDGLLQNNLALSAVPVLTTADFAAQAGSLDLTRLSTTLAKLNSAYSTRRSPAPSKEAGTPGGVTGTGSAAPSPDRSAQDTASLAAQAAKSAATRCPGPEIAGTTRYPIVLDGRPAVLVAHPVSDGTRLLQAWSCDGSQVLAFTTVPA